MTANEFIKKWQGVQLKEKSAYQEHFLDLCKLVEHPSPVETDKEGVAFCFEKGAIKTGGGNGWADVWKRGHFAMEYKGPGGDLQKALQQVQRYALALENPPLLVVSDVATIVITTNFTNTISETHNCLIRRSPFALRISSRNFLSSATAMLALRSLNRRFAVAANSRAIGIASRLSAVRSVFVSSRPPTNTRRSRGTAIRKKSVSPRR